MTKLLNVMLDSGAFGAWKDGTTIPINEYIAYVKDNAEWIDTVVSLDVIPGQFNRKRSRKQIDEAAEKSYRNHQTMKDAGLSPIPVFHQGEPWGYLERYLKDGETYIGLATFKDLPRRTWQPWLDDCFSILTDEKGRPVVKTHGFAITSFPLVMRYPWYSVDSTTWSKTAGYNCIFVPPYIDGKPNYLMAPARMDLGKAADWEALPHARHFIEQEVGIKLYEARYNTTLRRRATLVYFQRSAEARHVPHFRHKGFSLSRAAAGMPPIELGRLKMIYATTMKNHAWAPLMNGLNLYDRLVSYPEMKTTPHGTFEHYVMTGLPPGVRTPRRFGSDITKNYRDEAFLNRLRLNRAKRAEQQSQEEEGN